MEESKQRNYLIDKVKEQIINENLSSEDVKRRNDLEWRILENYIKDDGSHAMRSMGFRLTPEDLEEAISRAGKEKKNIF